MAKRTHKPKAVIVVRPIVPIEQIDAAASELRADHPLVTDEQARFVHLLIQTGDSIRQLAMQAQVSENWAYYHMSKSHVAAYRQAVAIRALGWASSAALSTMRRLLDAKSDYIKLEAARDLLDRGGMTLEPERSRGSGAVFNFNLTPMAVAQVSEPVAVSVVVDQMGPIGIPAHNEEAFKIRPVLADRGNHTHAQGHEVAPDE